MGEGGSGMLHALAGQGGDGGASGNGVRGVWLTIMTCWEVRSATGSL